MPASKISRKGQVTVPVVVRKAIGVKPGDSIAYVIEKSGAVRIRKADVFDAAYHAALSKTLTEWTSREDDEAFRHL